MSNEKVLVKNVTRFRVRNNVDNNVEDIAFVKLGDIGIFVDECPLTFNIQLTCETWNYAVWFKRNQLELVEGQKNESPDLIIYKSRWDEIIDNLEGGYGMTDEEVEVVKSVLKNNVPFNVVEKPVVIDPVIEKEDQTHLDANYVGVGRNGCFYYRSEILKQWFYWNEDYEWGECDFDYNDVGDVLPVSFGIVIGESK